MFSSEIWRSVASNHYLELGQILNGAQINLLPGERVLRISITNLLIFPCADPLCERGVFMWTPQRKRCLQHTYTLIYLCLQTPVGTDTCKMHTSAYLAILDLTCTSAHTVGTCFLIQNHAELSSPSRSLHTF